MNKPRLLIVTRNFPPLWGGMERLNWHMAQQLTNRFDVRVIAPEGAAAHAPTGVVVREATLRPLSALLLQMARLARREAGVWRPEIVLAGSGLTAPIAWLAARHCGARTAAYVHGLDLTVPHPVYRALWVPALRRMDRLIANSGATAQLAHAIAIAPEHISVVHPGVDIPAFDTAARVRFRRRHIIADAAPVLLSVGRLTARKGLREFVMDVLPSIAAARADVVLAVVGDAPAHALYAQVQTQQSILDAARAAGVASNVRLLGKLFGQDLADAYFGADLHAFPVRQIPHDPEGFGMVAVEAAAHGLPTVAYATGGVVDAVANAQSGRLIDPHDAHAFAEAALELLSSPIPVESCRRFAQAFAWEGFGESVMSALQLQDSHPS